MQQRSEPHHSLDDFPTPPWATRAMLEHMQRHFGWSWEGQSVREPAANRGHMVKPLAERFARVEASDIHDYGAGFPDRTVILLPRPCLTPQRPACNRHGKSIGYGARCNAKARQGLLRCSLPVLMAGLDRNHRHARRRPIREPVPQPSPGRGRQRQDADLPALQQLPPGCSFLGGRPGQGHRRPAPGPCATMAVQQVPDRRVHHGFLTHPAIASATADHRHPRFRAHASQASTMRQSVTGGITAPARAPWWSGRRTRRSPTAACRARATADRSRPIPAPCPRRSASRCRSRRAAPRRSAPA